MKITRDGAQARRLILLSGAVLIATIVGATAVYAALLRKQALEASQRQLAGLVSGLARESGAHLGAASAVLDGIAEAVRPATLQEPAALRRRMGRDDVYRMLKDQTRGAPQVEFAAVLAANGDLLNSTRDRPAAPDSFADRDFFEAHLKDPQLADFISAGQDKVGGKLLLILSRRIGGADGALRGMVLVGIPADLFSRAYAAAAAQLGAGVSVSLKRGDGTLMARFPAAEGPTAEARLEQSRALEKFPVIVSAVASEATLLAGWRRSVASMAAFAGGGIVLALAALVLLARRVGKSAATESAPSASAPEAPKLVLAVDALQKLAESPLPAAAVSSAPPRVVIASPGVPLATPAAIALAVPAPAQPAAGAMAAAPALSDAVSAFDYAQALTETNQQLVGMIARSALEQYPLDMRAIRDGLGAGDGAVVARAAQAMSGTLAVFKARPALALARGIEKLARAGRFPEVLTELAKLEPEVAVLTQALASYAK